MAFTLDTHVNRVKRLLRDSQSKFYGTPSDPDELKDYVNESRDRVVEETACLRHLETVILNTTTDIYPFPTVSNSDGVSNVYNIWIHVGNTRVPLAHPAFTGLQNEFRRSITRTGRPSAFAVHAQNVYFDCIASQSYTTEWDLVYLPEDLPSGTSSETIPAPYRDLVQYWAARKAYLKDRKFEEADRLKLEYYEELGKMMHSAYQYRREMYTRIMG